MKMDEETKKKKDEVLRKIGRNIMGFQQVEHILKYLLANGEISGYASEIEANRERQVTKIRKQTLGHLVGQYLDSTLSSSEEVRTEPEDIKEPWFSFRHRIECSNDHYEERKKTLAAIVEERNDLIHHLLPKWDMNSSSSSDEIDLYLDKQREKILPEFELLKGEIKTLQQCRAMLAAFIDSKEGEKEFVTIPMLRQSQLFEWLNDIAEKKIRSDGWTVLSTAANIIEQDVPHEITELEQKYGYKKLKEFMLATEYFDIAEEPTDKGGIRVLYRIKPDLKSAEWETIRIRGIK